MTVFNPSIPQPNDDPTFSQADLLNNFGKLNTDWAVNHVPLTSGGNNGFHTKVQFPNVLPSDPVGLTGNQSVVYPKIGSGGKPSLFFANSTTVYELSNITTVISGNDNGIVTPFGFTINAGVMAAGVTTVTFAIPFTNGKVFSLLLTPSDPATVPFVSVLSITTSLGAVVGFVANVVTISPLNTTVYYFAIGN